MTNINWNEFEVQNNEQTDKMFPEKGVELKIGDSVVGVLRGIKTGVGRNKSNVYVLETASGEKVGVWGSTVIDARLSGVKEGQKIAVEYQGEVRGKNNTYKDFKIGVGRTEQSIEGMRATQVSRDLPSIDLEEEIKAEDIPF